MELSRQHNQGGKLPGTSGLQKRVVRRVLGATVVLCLVALAASQHATSNPVQSGKNTSSNKSSQIKLDVVHDTTKPASSSVTNQSNGAAEITTNSSINTSVTPSGNKVSMTVNGQPINVPDNGSTHQVVATPSGSTTVDVSNQNTGNGTAFNSNFTSTTQSISDSTTTFDSNINQTFDSP